MSDTVSETALINLNVLSNLYSLDQYQRLVIINSVTALINRNNFNRKKVPFQIFSFLVPQMFLQNYCSDNFLITVGIKMQNGIALEINEVF